MEALSRDKRELAEVLGVAVPDGWPQFPEAFAPPEEGGSSRSERPPTDWRGYFFVHPRGRVLVGNGGFTGDPDDSGVVEIGYEFAPEHRNRGFATGGGAGHDRLRFRPRGREGGGGRGPHLGRDERLERGAAQGRNVLGRRSGRSGGGQGVAVADKQGRTPPRGCRKYGIRVHMSRPRPVDKEGPAVYQLGANFFNRLVCSQKSMLAAPESGPTVPWIA